MLERLATTVAGLVLFAAIAACDRGQVEGKKAMAGPSAEASRAPATSPVPSASATQAAATAPAACPEGMVSVPGGEFWVGSAPEEHFSADESPRFLTRLAPFCLDATEVTAGAYDACIDHGACDKVRKRSVLCNGGAQGSFVCARPCIVRRPPSVRPDHPQNCVTFSQAEGYCKARGARLPTEVEWEYAARGGAELRKYPWGDAAPDGRACWKHAGTCPVKSYPAGAFGLFDMSGNVWEWTDSWYGPYPWPLEHGFAKVYRGGSFSRRFEKWMHTRLRDRGRPDKGGAHLGFRCALTLSGTECPFGRDAEGRCRHGVLARDCRAGESWNGVRCAPPGAPPCREGRSEKPGFGCVSPEEVAAENRDIQAEARLVSRAPAPEFDADCRKNQPGRPRAFRYAGGSHDARTLVSRRDGCKNRDVGVGWNSTCCP